VLEKPFTLDTLRKRLATIQVARKNGAAGPGGAGPLATDGLVARSAPLAKPDEPRLDVGQPRAAA